MPVSQLTDAPEPPLRSENPATFSAKAEAFVEWQAETFTPEMQAVIDEINALGLEPGAGLPSGGTAGQVLTKQSASDGDADWETPAAGSIGDLANAGDGLYLLSTFRNSDMTLHLAGSNDGITWQWVGEDIYTPPSEALRDPSIIRSGGYFWLVYTNPPLANVYAGVVTHFGIAKSSDLTRWEHVADISMSAITGVDHVWAPEWFEDDDGLHVLFCANTDGSSTNGFKIYETSPDDDTMATWAAPTEVTGTGFPTSMLDPFVVKIGSTYYLWFKNNGTERLGYATSSSLTSGYTTVQSGVTDWSGFGSPIEGASLVEVENGIWRIYYDEYTDAGMYWAESDDLFATWTAPQLVTAPAGSQVLNHGSVVRTVDPLIQSKIIGASIQAQRPAPSGGASLRARGYRSTAVNTTSAGWQNIVLNAEDYDPDNIFDTSNGRFTPTVEGYYLVNLRFRSNSAPTTLAAAIGKNGANHFAVGGSPSGSTFLAVGGSGLVYCNGSSDYLTMRVYAASAVAVTTGSFDTWMEVVGPIIL